MGLIRQFTTTHSTPAMQRWCLIALFCVALATCEIPDYDLLENANDVEFVAYVDAYNTPTHSETDYPAGVPKAVRVEKHALNHAAKAYSKLAGSGATTKRAHGTLLAASKDPIKAGVKAKEKHTKTAKKKVEKAKAKREAEAA